MRNFIISSKLQKFAKREITPLQMQFIYNLGKMKSSKNIIGHSKFLHDELSIRLSKRVYNLFNLPYGLPLVSEITDVINLYSSSFNKIQELPAPNCMSSVKDFTYTLKEIKDNHNLLEEIIGSGLQRLNNPFIDYGLINYELNNFFISRIGIRTLISQQVQNVLYDKSIIVDCNIKTIMEDAIKEVSKMIKIQTHSDIPPCISLTNNSKNTIHYIPGHLFYIFLEVLKNSVVAHQAINETIEYINVSIQEGNNNYVIKVSDRGGGFEYENVKKTLSYSYSTSPKINSIRTHTNLIMSGLGFGLPLAKQYCKYFGGDLIINPIEGYGTDVYIYIHKLDKKAEQLL